MIQNMNPINDNIIFTIWFGDNFNDNRKNGLKSLIKKSKCKVILITQKNLHLFVKKNYPLHKGFNFLSDIHKFDYLRCYLMKHYGGGYSDIKATSGSSKEQFNIIRNNKKILPIGNDVDGGIAYPEENSKKNNKKLDNNYDKLIGIQLFIMRPNTELTNQWYIKLHQRMDNYYPLLKKYPAKFSRESKSGTPCPVWEGAKLNTKYPISWNRILGQILFPLQLNYLDRIIKGIPNRADGGNYK